MRALVVSNGFPPQRELLKDEIEKADLLIGADGGSRTILKHGFTPDVVIGDLDSFEAPESPTFKVIHKPDQETNDLEKALNYAIEQRVLQCIVLGAFGYRMDHSVKNLSVLNKFHDSFEQLVFRDEVFDAILVNEEFSTRISAGNIVSLFPVSGEVTGIRTGGLKYSLEDESLKNGVRDGTSNEATSDKFSVRIKTGELVVFYER